MDSANIMKILSTIAPIVLSMLGKQTKDNGFGIDDAKESIILTDFVRNSIPIGMKGDYHPFANKKLSKHPFK